VQVSPASTMLLRDNSPVAFTTLIDSAATHHSSER
jgi:hypothetical protein